MKAMMCEANRKEDRMCGKQMEREEAALGKAQSAASPPAHRLCLKCPEPPALPGTSIHPLSRCHRAPHGHSWRNGRDFPAGCRPGCPTAAPRCGVFGAEPKRCSETGLSPTGGVPRASPPPPPPLRRAGTPSHWTLRVHLFRRCLSALTSATPLVTTGWFYLPARCCNSAQNAEHLQ